MPPSQEVQRSPRGGGGPCCGAGRGRRGAGGEVEPGADPCLATSPQPYPVALHPSRAPSPCPHLPVAFTSTGAPPAPVGPQEGTAKAGTVWLPPAPSSSPPTCGTGTDRRLCTAPALHFWGVTGLDTLRAKVVAASHARCGSRGAGGEHPGDAQRRKQEGGSGAQGAGGCGGAQPCRRRSTVARREPCPGEQTEAGWSQEDALCAAELPHIRGAQQQPSLTGKQP